MQVHRSQRHERLVDALARTVAEPLAHPLAADHLVVPSRGAGRWVAMALADRHGVAANLTIQRPIELVEHVLALSDGGHEAAPWQPERLTPALAALLASGADDPGLAPLQAWTQAGPAEPSTRRWQLARRLAGVFHRYAVHRPGLALAWSAGDDADVPGDLAWQPHLWRLLEARLGPHHLPARLQRLLAAPALPPGLPARICVFGVPILPPLAARLLRRLGQETPVHVFQLAPHPPSTPAGPEPPLLASLGRVTRDAQASLAASLGPTVAHDHFAPSPGPSALGVLQDDLLARRVRAPEARVVLRGDDASLQVLGCHAPLRELEVLRDTLWSLLHADPSLRPRDILVLVPDLAATAPLIDAVFGLPPGDPLHLPHTVADRPRVGGDEVGPALLALVGLVGTRLTASQVLGLLGHAPIRRRFGLHLADLPRLEALVARAKIRWGRDAAHRAAEGCPPVEVGTWRWGLERLLLGHAVEGVPLLLGRAPCAPDPADADQADAALVGCLADLYEAVVDALDALAAPRPVAGHLRALRRVVDAWFGGEEGAPALGQALLALEDEVAGVGDDVALAVARELVEQRVLARGREGGFLREGVTFCELGPLRAVPARVVAVVGLSDGAFPRVDADTGLDLLVRAPRPGDPSRRHLDRHLVLEALLAARDTFVATYVSRSVHDNAPRPPSVVLADLLDALDATFAGADAGSARDHVVAHHPLQPFSPRYVTAGDDRPVVTWDEAAAQGAAALAAGPGPASLFFQGEAPPLRPVQVVELDELARFLVDPVGWFLEHRLGVAPARAAAAPAEEEPTVLSPREERALTRRLLALRRRGLSWSACAEVLQAEGGLPPGHLANPPLARAAHRVRQLLEAAAPRLSAPGPPPAWIDVELEGVRLLGRLDALHADARVELGLRTEAPTEGRARLGCWVRHLALQLAPGHVPRVSERYAHDGRRARCVLRLPPLPAEAARGHLARLVRLHVEGHARPVPLLADAGWALVRADAEGLWPLKALGKARGAAEAWWRDHPASEQAWERLVGGRAPFRRPPERLATPTPFERYAREVLGPLHHHQEPG